MKSTTSALIIGGGIIGCSIALELAQRGFQTTVLDQGKLNQEATNAAAGMLGAHAETHRDGAFFELCKASQRMYQRWSDDIYGLSEVSPQYIREGIVRVALTETDEQELRSRLPWIGNYTWQSADELRKLEPAITPAARGGLFFQADHQVHPRHLAIALRAALLNAGCKIMESTAVQSLLVHQGRMSGVKTTAGELKADYVIVAAGAWSSALLSTVGVNVPIFPVKGQCYSLRPETPTIRRTVFSPGCYVLPRMNGTLTIGATQVEAGFDQKTTVSDLASLHQLTTRLLPELEHAELLTTWVGLRPGTRDGLPYMGKVADLEGLIVAAGHFRNGILLAPITGKLIGQLLCGESPELDLAPYSLTREIVDSEKSLQDSSA